MATIGLHNFARNWLLWKITGMERLCSDLRPIKQNLEFNISLETDVITSKYLRNQTKSDCARLETLIGN